MCSHCESGTSACSRAQNRLIFKNACKLYRQIQNESSLLQKVVFTLFSSIPSPANEVRNVMNPTSLMVAKCFEIPEWKDLHKWESLIRIIIIANCTGTI